MRAEGLAVKGDSALGERAAQPPHEHIERVAFFKTCPPQLAEGAEPREPQPEGLELQLPHRLEHRVGIGVLPDKGKRQVQVFRAGVIALDAAAPQLVLHGAQSVLHLPVRLYRDKQSHWHLSLDIPLAQRRDLIRAHAAAGR